MAKEKDDGEFWRGYVWGLFTPPLVGAGLGLIGAVTSIVIAVATQREPGDVLRSWRGDESIPPPGPGPIDVEAS